MDQKTVEKVLPPHFKRFLMITNLLLAVTVMVDLLHITKTWEQNIDQLFYFNLIVMTLGVCNFLLKRAINNRIRMMNEPDEP